MEKSALGQRSTSKKHVTSMSYKLEPAIWSHDTGQWIPCFDRCQLIITWMPNIREVHSYPMSLSSYYLNYGRHLARIRRRRVRAYAPTSNTRKFIDGFPFLSHMSMKLRLEALRAAGAPLLTLVETKKSRTAVSLSSSSAVSVSFLLEPQKLSST